MAFFNFLKKPTRKEIIKNKSISLFNQIKGDYYNFTPLEKAEIIKNINIEFLKELDSEYTKAYKMQQEVLKSKELIK